ncbi:MAG: SARP family transcriptional regulator [Treponema sp.]|jgi:hypothetical protein|nr:SARP family transcriptional regulator [Treponema sp.]
MFEDEADLEDLETQTGVDQRRPRAPLPPPARKTRSAIGPKPYTPQFSPLATVSVRRFAWALGLTMPKAVDRIVALLPTLVSPAVVCAACKDNSKCHSCAFHQQDAAAPAVPAA